jgi:outer membrane protein TolC
MRTLCVALVVSVACLSAKAAAQEAAAPPYQPPAFLSEPPSLPDGWDTRGVWRLQLREALRVSVKNNLGIVLQREALRGAEAGERIARGSFEPRVAASYFHSDVDVLPQSSVEGSPGEVLTLVDDGWNLSVAERLPTGTSVEVGFTSGRSRSTLGTAVQPLNYRSVLSIDVTQPILRGFSVDLDMPRVEILRAELTLGRARGEMVAQLMEVVQRTETAYWDVVQALRGYRVQHDSLELARTQMELTRRQISDGLLAPSDLTAAESTLAQRQLQLVQSEADIERAWDRLRAELNLPQAAWRRAIVPVDSPAFDPTPISDEDALRAALRNRPEVRQQGLDVERAILDLRQAENERLPQIDLGLHYQVVGQDDRYGGALDQVGGVEAPGWQVMVSLSWTPLQQASRAAVDAQRSGERAARVRRDQVVLDLYRAVREAVRNLESAARQVRAAARFRELAERSLDAEQRRFMNGTSSNFLVAERQADVARAQLEELGALLGHQTAALAVERETGRVLDARGIAVGPR